MQPPKARVLVSFHQVDTRFLDPLETQLRLLERQGYVHWWSRHDVVAGDDPSASFATALVLADIVLVLVSSDYLANDTCWSVELGRAFELHDEGTVRVIPVLVRTSRWQETPVARVQFLPRDGRAIACRERDSAWVTVAEEIALAIKHWRSDPSRRFMGFDPD